MLFGPLKQGTKINHFKPVCHLGWSCSSAVEHMTRICKALGLVSSPDKQKETPCHKQSNH